MADTTKVTSIRNFTGGITRHDLDRSPGVGLKFQDVDIFQNENYIQPSKLPVSDTLPSDTSPRIWGYELAPDGTLYAVTSNDAEDKVKIIKLRNAGSTDPGSWENFYINNLSVTYNNERNNIVYHELSDSTDKLYFVGDEDYLYSIGDITETGFTQTFSTTTTDSDPGAGTFRLNNATYSSVTQVYVDILNSGGSDMTSVILDNVDQGMLRLVSVADTSVYILFSIEARSTPSGYRKYDVTYIESSGTLPTTAAGVNLIFYDVENDVALLSVIPNRLPMERANDEVYIGNRTTIDKIDGTDVYFDPAFTLPDGWRVADMVPYETNMAILATQTVDYGSKFSTNSGTVKEPQHGTSKVYLWDKTAETGFISEVDIPSGGPLAIEVLNNQIIIFCSQDSRLNIYVLESLQPTLIKSLDCAPAVLDNTATAESFIIELGSVYISNDKLYFGLAGVGAASGLYVLSRSSAKSPFAITQLYALGGTAVDGSGYTYSAISAGNNLYWSVSNNQGVGFTSFTQDALRLEGGNNPLHSTNAIYESVWIDVDAPDLLKEWVGVIVNARSMPTSGCEIRIDARVDNSTNFFSDVSSITRVATTATVTMANSHGFNTGDSIVISGANETDYNGTFTITVTGATTFTYTVSGSPDTPATGVMHACVSTDVLTQSNDQSSYPNTTDNRFWYRQWKNMIGRRIQLRLRMISDGANKPQIYSISVLSKDLNLV